MNVVLDTNVLISAILWPGPSNKILRLIDNDKLTLCLTAHILDELFQVLKRTKFHTRLNQIDASPRDICRHLAQKARLVTPAVIPSVIEKDPSDNHVLACALASKSRYIISGDKHLLELRTFQKIPIITPKQFLETMPSSV